MLLVSSGRRTLIHCLLLINSRHSWFTVLGLVIHPREVHLPAREVVFLIPKVLITSIHRSTDHNACPVLCLYNSYQAPDHTGRTPSHNMGAAILTRFNGE
eukprot:4303303-Amphidinium_carterae.3